VKPGLTPVDPITANLLKLIGTKKTQKPKLAILGRDGQQVENLLVAILGPESRLKKVESATFQHLEIGERRVGDAQFEIIGVSMEQQFTRLLDTVARELVGYIVIVEAQRKDDVEYLNYLLGTLKTLYRLPMGIAVVKSKNEKNLSVDALRDLLGAEAMDYMRECDPSEVNSIIEFWTGFCADANLQRCTPPEKTGTS
jgi:signal recognition particle receptor subunit beta